MAATFCFGKEHMKNKSGFTLVELLLVIVIIGIIASIVIPMMGAQAEKSRMGQAANTMGILMRAIEAHIMANPWMVAAGAGQTFNTGLAGDPGTWTANDLAKMGLSQAPSDKYWRYAVEVNGLATVTAARKAQQIPSGCTVGDQLRLQDDGSWAPSNGCYSSVGSYSAISILQ